MFSKWKQRTKDDGTPIDGGQNGEHHPPSTPPPIPARQAAPTTNGHHANGNVQKPKLVFHCQLAHGSPTGFLTGFSNVRELYHKIAECYEMPVSEVRREIKSA